MDVHYALNRLMIADARSSSGQQSHITDHWSQLLASFFVCLLLVLAASLVAV
jgi:hypothetical protein